MPEDAIAALRGQLAERVRERYEGRMRGFTKLRAGLLLFGGLFLVLILLPYGGMRRDRRIVESGLAGLPSRVQSLEARVGAYEAASEGLARLRERCAGGAAELREAVVGFLALPTGTGVPGGPLEGPGAQSPQMQMQQNVAPPMPVSRPLRCAGIAERKAWLDCLVAATVRDQFDDYARLLDTDVIAPVQRVDSSAAADSAAGRLQAGLDSLRLAVEGRLAANPAFWNTIGGKVDFFSQLEQDIRSLWAQYGFGAQRQALAQALTTARAEQAVLTARRDSLGAREKELASRLADIESPLGPVPVGTEDAVRLFPWGMLLGFAALLWQLRELIGVRAAYVADLRREDPAGQVLTPPALDLLAPLPVDPARPWGSQALEWGLTLAPAAMGLLGFALR